MQTFRVGYLVGSLAKASINRKLAAALAKLAPPELVLEEIAIGELRRGLSRGRAPLQAGHRRRRRGCSS